MPETNDLSEREREILTLVAKGASNKEIARDLHISTNTVKVHLRNIFSKIDANSRTEAAMYAVNTGIVDIGGNGSTASQSREQVPTNRNLFLGLGAVLIIALVVVFGILAVSGVLDRNQSNGNQPNFPIAEGWQEKAALPEAREGLALVSYDGDIYAIGGESINGILDLVEQYDPVLDNWSVRSPKPVPVTEASGAVISGKVYIPGGRTSTGEVTDILEIYSPLDDSWEKGKNLPVGLSAYAIASYEGDLYLFGGWDGEQYVNSVYEYVPELDQWNELTPMPTARGYAGAAVAGGKIYVVGGFDGNTALDLNQVFIPELDGSEAGPWNTAESLPAGRYSMGVAGLGNMVYAVGGVIEEGGLHTSLLYSPQENIWQEFDSPNDDTLENFGIVPLDNQLYVMGGKLGDDLTAINQAYQAVYTIVIPIIR